MGTLKILASGDSPQARSQARGKLFEKLASDVLRTYGFMIDTHNTNINFAGMEIDIEGKTIINDIPLYAECKCYDTDITAPKLSEFFGKYMTRWFKNKYCQGLFIALPGINPHAKGFYEENIASNSDVNIKILQEVDVLKALLDSKNTVTPEVIQSKIPTEVGTPGDWLLLFTDGGLFWLQYVIPIGSGISSKIALFNNSGEPISDRFTTDLLIDLYPEIQDFERIAIQNNTQSLSITPKYLDEIVEVRGSSECFEYQFPASPDYFVGRDDALSDFDVFILKVINKETSSRGILFEANSGWGKSSIVLSCINRLRAQGHIAVAIDSRSASTSQFILRVIDYTVKNLNQLGNNISQIDTNIHITGFEGAIEAILGIALSLDKQNKLLVIFLDQFENLFFLEDALRHIRDFFLKVCDSSSNIILGFSWKTDLVGQTNDFPYRIRDDIASSSMQIRLTTFSELETNAILEMLSTELNSPLRKDLKFFLSEFSQGYPWLLKKLCAHVKSQREQGVQQAEIARSLLNIESLFQEDLQGLSSEQEESLRHIARSSPISVSELGEEFDPEIVQSLIDRRLIVRIANKYDIYWDIFRDYLNYGRLPIQENYILRTQVTTCIKASSLLNDANGTLTIPLFISKVGLSDKSFYNVAKDMDLLGLAKISEGNIKLQIPVSSDTSSFQLSLRNHLQERLPRNRLVWRFLTTLSEQGNLTIIQMAILLEKWCPYISATESTWLTYARNFAGWMDAADLVIWGVSDKQIRLYDPGTEIRERDLLLLKRRAISPIYTLQIQYGPVEDVLERLINSVIRRERRIDWTGLTRSTIYKSMATLEGLNYIHRDSQSKLYIVQSKLQSLALSPSEIKSFLRDAVLEIESFKVFLQILKDNEKTKISLLDIGKEFKKRFNLEWTDSTARISAKIMLNWARSTELAPESYIKPTRRYRSRKTMLHPGQLRLF